MLRLSRRLAPTRSVAAVAPLSSPRIIPRSPFSTHPARPAQSLRSTSAVHTSPSTLALLQTFDVPHSNSTSASLAPHGLFNQPTLLHPTDFVPLAVRTILRAKLIVEKICRPQPTSYGSLEEVERAFLVMVKDLDRLSDRLCGVIDLAELVRNVHPDPEWTTQANEAYEVLCEYMNVLNTHTGLYHALKSLHSLLPLDTAAKSPELYAACAVALPFLRDFEKSGIHLPDLQRTKFVDLSTNIMQLGRKFLMNASEQKVRVQLGRDEVESTFGTGFAEKVFRQAGGVDPNSWEGRVLARQHPEEDMRKKMYLAANSAPDSHIETLEDLLTTRAELARLVERESWGEVALEDKMARDPISVMTFLDSLNTHNRPLALADVEVLERAKRAHLGTGRGTKINAWDRDFYTDYSASTSPTGDISPFFSLGTCFVGLSQLFSSLYGIRFEVESVSPGECWDPLVRKLRVIDEEDGTIGTIYADLFARGGKASGAAHYTVRCSRRIDDDNPSDDFPLGVPTIEGVECAPEDVEGLSVEGVKWRGKEGSHQEPLIVLVCGFAAEGGAQGKCLLQWGEVETLFHEMGHAIHSMIGRTPYHNVSGTRCATDFVELPSILMEHFLASPAVLSSFAKHHNTGRELPSYLVAEMMQERKRFSALETGIQIQMAALDQSYHSSSVLDPDARDPKTGRYSSLRALQEVHKKYSVIPHAAGTHWSTSFSHLFGYGATYYSYLFDRSIAAKIFRDKFDKDPMSREAGEGLKRDLLRWGGGREPWECVGEVLGDDVVSRGGAGAMRRVGEWGIVEQ